jgi:hypothetical protein
MEHAPKPGDKGTDQQQQDRRPGRVVAIDEEDIARLSEKIEADLYARIRVIHLQLPFDAEELSLLYACWCGDLVNLERFLQHGCTGISLSLDEGFLNRLEWLLYHYAALAKVQQICCEDLLSVGVCCAAENNQIEIVRFVLECCSDTGMVPNPSFLRDFPALVAIYHRNLDLLRYLVEEIPKLGYQPVNLANTRLGVDQRDEDAQLAVLRYLVEQAPGFGQPLPDLSGVLADVIFHGKPAMLQYLVEELPYITGQIVELDHTAREICNMPEPGHVCLAWYDSRADFVSNLKLLKELGVPHQRWRELTQHTFTSPCC